MKKTRDILENRTQRRIVQLISQLSDEGKLIVKRLVEGKFNSATALRLMPPEDREEMERFAKLGQEDLKDLQLKQMEWAVNNKKRGPKFRAYCEKNGIDWRPFAHD